MLFMFKLQRLFMAVQGRETDTVTRSVRPHKRQLAGRYGMVQLGA